MAKVVGGVGTSHVPAVGVAVDNKQEDEPYWAPFFQKLKPIRSWIDGARPDVLIVVYNDHASAFSLELIPTFALGVASEFLPADEGYGPRPVPPLRGHPELAWHLAESLILESFDITIANNLTVDHGCTVPLSVLFGSPSHWPCSIVPLCVNVIQYPPPTGRRCFDLGRSIRRSIDTYSGDERVVIVGTGGMSHQLQGERAGLINAEFDLDFLDRLVTDPESQADMAHIEYLREAGSEGIELIMWLVMRGALDRNVQEVHRAHHVPTSNTSNGLIVLENLAVAKSS